MNADQISGKIIHHTYKLMIWMIILLFSIIVHYFVNNNYYNISTDVEKCPFCYGNNLCALFDNNEITYTNLTIREKISNIFNTKNVYIANYNSSKVVLKKLGHNWELLEIDYLICKDQQFEGICPPYPDSFTKDYTTNIIEYLSNDPNTILNLKLCSSSTLNYFVNSIFSLYTNVNVSVMTANVWTTILANVEPIMLQLLKSEEGWPVPKYYGSCGRITVQEHSGRSLHNVENEPWILRANLALQLLQAAHNFTNKHPIFRFYLTDISSDNIVVTDDNTIKFIDLENVIITDKTSTFDDFHPHISENFDCGNCYAFSQEEICAHTISDHNFYSICKLLLSKSSPWPMMQNGLLHSPPKNVLETFPEIFDYIETCALSGPDMNRFEASRKLISLLELILQ